MRQVDDELWRLPFAKSTWPRQLYRYTDPHLHLPSAIQGPGAILGYQAQIWREQGGDLREWLLDTPASSEFWRVINAQKLTQRLNEVSTHPNMTKVIKSLMCACAIRLALTEPLRPVQLRRPQSLVE